MISPDDKQDNFNPNDFSGDDFDDLSLFAGIQSEAEEARQEQQDRENRAPVSYLDEGSYWIRLYPEIRLEEDGKSRRMHVVRKFWSYTGLAKGVRRLPAPRGEADLVRPEVMRLKDANYGESWKFMASEEGLIKVNIYRSSLPKDHKYIKLNTPMFLILRRKQTNALNEFLAELSPENLRTVLNPRNTAPLIKVSYTKGSGGSASFGFDLEQKELPPLPETFPSMFDVIINDETPLATDEELAKIRKSVSAVLAMQSNLINPDADSGAAPATTTSTERRSAAAAAVQEALKGQREGSAPDTASAGEPGAKESESEPEPAAKPAEPEPVVEKEKPKPAEKAKPAAKAATPAPAADEPKCPSTDENLEFGRHQASHLDCITCPYETECAKASALP